MILKKIEIAGFKSFGKKVELVFDTPVTAIVGPNGSGKSNVSEAIRWVLGEQSIKSLRGKRGEDLIFHGSGEAAQLGKARVGIVFDNTEQTFPIDFSEIIISREVYRDGVNEYRINDSQVRLKDVIELMSNVGVGGSAHHIISQGEADRALYASAKDRKIMIEDALGLRIYHIKQQEAERKLASTAENMREVSMLRREIQPHMRFLREEAAKIESSQKMREELVEHLRMYLNREASSLEAHQHAFENREDPLKEILLNAEKEAKILRGAILEKQSVVESGTSHEMEKVTQQLAAKEAERQQLERDMGRVEGQLSVFEQRKGAQQTARTRTWPAGEVETELHSFLSMVDAASVLTSLEDVIHKLLELKERIQQFLYRSPKKDHAEEAESERRALHDKREKILQRLQTNEEEKNDLLQKKNTWDEMQRDKQAGFWENQKRLRATEDRINSAKDALRSLEVDRERLRMRRDEFQREEQQAKPFLSTHVVEEAKPWPEDERAKAYQKIQRLRIKLEEVGGVNPQVLREYEEVGQRDAFLAKELDDLQKTEKSLRELQQQLEKELEQGFSQGIKKINEKFNELFQAMFGGGGAKLALVKLQSREEGEDAQFGNRTPKLEIGVDISVDIPRKRVKNLDMLSGGERALTSIALLFAMSFVNPPPFLVLDETDAALDEANSQRYGAMLRNLSDKTQLIVITHNRQTMKEAGVLYGVTMGSDGISRLLSLKFEEAAEVSGN